MKYTDKELIRASQIAYLNINQRAIELMDEEIKQYNQDHPNATVKLNYTLSELFRHSKTFRASSYKDICTLAGIEYGEDKDYNYDEVVKDIGDTKIRQMIWERFQIINDITNGEIGSWKVVSYVDNNNIFETGMAGKLVDGSWVHSNFSESGDGLAAMVFETGDRITAM